jgi:hypothetical protein
MNRNSWNASVGGSGPSPSSSQAPKVGSVNLVIKSSNMHKSIPAVSTGANTLTTVAHPATPPTSSTTSAAGSS